MKEKEENEENIITTNSSDSINFKSQSSNDVEEVDPEKMKVEIEDIKAEFTNVARILSESEINLEERDLFDVVKFTIKVKAVVNYTWYVYRRPYEIKKNFENISDELNKKNIVLSGNFTEIFNTVAGWSDDGIEIHISEIENFYKNLFQNIVIYNTQSFQEFFNISLESFNQNNGGEKPFEGFVYKKADPHCLRQIFSVVCYCIEYFAFAQYNLRWMVVKNDSIYYKDKLDSRVGKYMYNFDNESIVRRVGRDSINITNTSRTLIMKFKTLFEREIWFREIKTRLDRMKQILLNNKYHAYVNEKKYNLAHWFIDGEKYFSDLAQKLSEAQSSIFITDWWMSPEVWLIRPVPINTYVSMEYNNIKRKENPPYSRLMDILYQCANRGVKVYIQVYAEYKQALTLNSIHTKRSLISLHPNIKVVRHPIKDGTLLWSHHEKLVIIDQIIAYVGGIDLCWGRYDTNDHPISEPKSNNDNPEYLFPGIDYSNARMSDFSKVENYLKESVDRETEARMPWHDVHCRIIGPVAIDIARHFAQRYNFARFGKGEGITDIKQDPSVSQDYLKKTDTNNPNTVKEKLGGFLRKIIKDKYQSNNDKKESLIPGDDVEKENDNINMINIIEVNNNKENEEFLDTKEIKLKGKTKLRGKKKLNIKDETNNNNNIINTSEEEEKIDVITEENKNDEDEDDDDNIITTEDVDYTKKKGYEEIKKIKDEYMKDKIVIDKDHFYVNKNDSNEINTDSNLIENEENGIIISNDENKEKPQAYNNLVKYMGKHSKQNKGGLLSKIFEPKEEKVEEEVEQKLEDINIVNVNFFLKGIKSKVQVLRSAGEWSMGLKKDENSILQAYYRLIDKAEHYIYIENQFFVSRAFSEKERKKCPDALSDVVENLIALKIRNKIIKCYKENKKFRVFIFIPLLPGFAGEPKNSGTIQIILKHTYEAICRNHGMSIIEQLEKVMGDKWREYIGFYSLRGHAIINGIPTTEIIYIHSKLMIVDDTKVIIGSANINDRSMLGSRDSEFCALIKEKKSLHSRMDGKEYKAANFAFSFRVNLLAEHLGLDPKDPILVDPVNDKLLTLIQTRAANNTKIYRELFGCYPDDNYKKFNDIKKKRQFKDDEELKQFKELYENKKKEIIGHIVQFPLHFLENEDLYIPFFSLENLTPEHNYT